VDAHKGRIFAFSAGKDQGSTFVVELPSIAARPELSRLRPIVLPRVTIASREERLLDRRHASSGMVLTKRSSLYDALRALVAIVCLPRCSELTTNVDP